MPRGIPNIKSSSVDRDDTKELDIASTVSDDEIESQIVISNQPVGAMKNSGHLRELKFMEDEVTIIISTTSDPNAENPVPCGVNGETMFIKRGQRTKIKRKFVDSLIKSETTVTTKNYKDEDGLDQTRLVKVNSLKYPISVLEDPSGDMGNKWFEYVCRNAG